MILPNKKSYPIFVENEFEETKKIKLNSILNKNPNSKIFTNDRYEYCNYY